MPINSAFVNQWATRKVNSEGQGVKWLTTNLSESIVLDQAKKLVEENKIPEDFVRTADDLDDIAQKYKDEIRNQTVRNNYVKVFWRLNF